MIIISRADAARSAYTCVAEHIARGNHSDDMCPSDSGVLSRCSLSPIYTGACVLPLAISPTDCIGALPNSAECVYFLNVKLRVRQTGIRQESNLVHFSLKM